MVPVEAAAEEEGGKMLTIHKYSIALGAPGFADVQMRSGAHIISVHPEEGRNGVLIWAIVDTENAMKLRRICLAWTGDPLPSGCSARSHVGTVRLGDLVYHIFDLG